MRCVDSIIKIQESNSNWAVPGDRFQVSKILESFRSLRRSIVKSKLAYSDLNILAGIFASKLHSFRSLKRTIVKPRLAYYSDLDILAEIFALLVQDSLGKIIA